MRMQRSDWRQSGRAGVLILVVVIALAAGLTIGLGIAKRKSGATVETAAAGTEPGADAEQWYTCGMHPNVLQKGPGKCPICHMKLTPRKTDRDEGGTSGGSTERRVLYWRAPMDPSYVSKKPGKSPMGMDLVPVYAEEGASPSAHDIRIDPVTVQNMGIRTAMVKRGPLVKTIRTVGRVDYDEQKVNFVDTKFSGWIESLHVDETGMPVETGQPLFDVYSPELYAAQEEYLAAVRNLPRLEGSSFALAREEAAKLVEAATTKLKYLDVSDAQIARLRDTDQVEKTLAIYSPATGVVTEKMALAGMYVKPGMRLYTIADLSRVWVYVDVYEYQLPWVRVGQQAFMTLPYVRGREFRGTVVYIYPYLDERTRVVKVRLEFENPTLELKPGMYANVRLQSQLKRDALLIPRESYIDTGLRQVLFVDRGDGKFAPRDIQVGVEAEDGMVEALYGVDEGETIVTSGQFLLDAESKLKEAVAKMIEIQEAATSKEPAPKESGPNGPSPGEHPPTPADSNGTAPTPSGPVTASIPADAAYACPMETHPDETDPAKQGAYFSATAGKCPRCGMKLKPLDQLDWVGARRAAKGGEVAYTCPQHPHVYSKTKGTCPRCGRKLMPFAVMYCCPNPAHADVVSRVPGTCPHCQRPLAPFRGMWLDPAMAADNVPPVARLAEAAPYHCPVHPLVHSDMPGHCTICGRPLERGAASASQPPVAEAVPGAGVYICPMHPVKVHSGHPGVCPICGMQLVRRDAFHAPKDAPQRVAAQMDYIMEHYLALQQLLAADRTADVARHALGIASASETLVTHMDDPAITLPDEARAAARRLHSAALRMSGVSLEADRVVFVDLSDAVRTLTRYARPSRKRWPKLYIYHCPMSKGDWIQPSEKKANPYYGFQMLRCGELKGIE